MFPEELSQEMPTFFIKNPNYDQYKPNMKYVSLEKDDQNIKPYRAVMGGVQVVLPEVSKERWQWTPSSYYRAVSYTHLTLPTILLV